MRVKYIASIVSAVVFGVYSFTAHANDMNNHYQNQNRMAQQPTSNYWQAPDWSGFAQPAANNRAPQQRMQNNNYRPPAPPRFRQPYPANNYPGPNRMNQPAMSDPGMNRPAPAYRQQNLNRANPYPAPRGPYQGSGMNQYSPDNGASAYNIPGYRQHRNNNRWNNNKFWGNSGPGRWMNPNKGNMEQGWDDMINSPSRMGEMPGGWNAPEVSMPNPIDIGDQMQDNVKDLPEQIKDMDVGN